MKNKLPPFIGMQNLQEPVCFFQKLVTSDENPDQVIRKIANIMNENGLETYTANSMTEYWFDSENIKSGYTNNENIIKPNTYILRQSQESGGKFIELITPFYSKENALTNIKHVFSIIKQVDGINFEGAVSPTHFYNINIPQSDKSIPDTEIHKFLMKKLDSTNFSQQDLFAKYQNNTDFLFRGHNFMYNSSFAPYATPTARAGRTGKVYGTDDIKYAALYSGAGFYNSSESAKIQYIRDESGDISNDIDIGFLTIYKKAPKALVFKNFGIEKVRELGAKSSSLEGRDVKSLLHKDKNGIYLGGKKDSSEVLMYPDTNPVIETYLLSKGKAIKIDISDKEWEPILNHFTPDLKNTFGNKINYADLFIKRLNKTKSDNKIKTFDIINPIIQQMTHNYHD